MLQPNLRRKKDEISLRMICCWVWLCGIELLKLICACVCVCARADPGSDGDSDSGDHGDSGSGPDDSHGDGRSSGGPAEAPPAAGGDSSHVASDPDSSPTQPRPAAARSVLHRLPRSAGPPAAAAADHQGSASPGGHQDKNPRQAQRGEQLSPAPRKPLAPPPSSMELVHFCVVKV